MNRYAFRSQREVDRKELRFGGAMTYRLLRSKPMCTAQPPRHIHRSLTYSPQDPRQIMNRRNCNMAYMYRVIDGRLHDDRVGAHVGGASFHLRATTHIL